MKNIFLIGMMGAGKSVLGQMLSKKTALPLLDMDIEIEKIMGMSIKKIFDEYGENRFRLIESAFFKECTKKKKYIYATGGGIILNPYNRNILKKNGLSLFLDCSVDTLISRITNETKNRPLLKNNVDLEKIYQERRQFYLDSSHYVINTTQLSPNESVKKIINYIKK